MKTNQYIKIDTGIRNWGWWSDPNVCALWLHLLILANYADGESNGVAVPRGSLITSIRNLSKETGLTVQQTRTALRKLLSTREITQLTTQAYTLITICKYDSYQTRQYVANKASNIVSNTPSNTQPTHNQHTTNTHSTHITKINTKEIEKEIYKEKEKKGDGELPVSSDAYAKFVRWSEQNAPTTLRMKSPMTEEEFRKLKEAYGSDAIMDVLGRMENCVRLEKKYKSCYLTAINWIKISRRNGNINQQNAGAARRGPADTREFESGDASDWGKAGVRVIRKEE